ncbi:MAG: dihydroorotase [Sandaracinaceae bacterium]|nr:dihydroorotase [Sandaracinaceae bacterium]
MLVIEEGRIIDPASGRDEVGDVVIEQGRILRVGRGASANLPFHPEIRRISARGLWVVPGLIDLHVHLREPGGESKEDIVSGLQAAAAGGFTAVCSMPNTNPPNDCPAITRYQLARAQAACGVRLYPFGAITVGRRGEKLTGMWELREAGAIGVSDDGNCVTSPVLMRRALEQAKEADLLLSQHCEESSLTHDADMHEGPISALLGLRGWPPEAEEIIVARDIILNERIGARYHVAHISTRGALRWVREAKARGIPVSAEVTPHHLFLSDRAVIGYRTFCKVNPPLRSNEDIAALREALSDGTIDCVATDHAPHGPAEKKVPFSEAAPGMIGLETALPLMLKLVRHGIISPSRMVEAMSTAPARIAKIEGGTLSPGAVADITIIDPDFKWVLTPSSLHSKQCNTPWLGEEMQGVATHTIVNGRIIFERKPR